MVTALFISGVVVILSGLITGFVTGSFLGFLLWTIGGIIPAMIFFALAQILDNQETILFNLGQQEVLVESLTKKTDKTCSSCSHTYDRKMSSCPNCGRRE